jgi:nitroreductase
MTRPPFTEEHLHRAVTAAVQAPSMHNSQPWRFRLRDGAIEVLADPSRQLPVADRSGWAMRMACGAAVFNARLALAVTGMPANVRLRPDLSDPHLMARLVPGTPRPPTPPEQELYAAIARRRSNRRPFFTTPVPLEARASLVEAARAEGAWLELVNGMLALSMIAEIARNAEHILRRQPGYQAELSSWTRTEAAPDGVPLVAAGTAPEPQDLLPQRSFTGRLRAPGRDFEAEPLLAVLGCVGDSPADQITGGQALQRVLLTATTAGLATSLISQPIEVPGARERLRVALHRYGAPQMVLRIGYGQPAPPTPRRDVDDVIDP